MRAMWRTYGKPGGSREGYVDHPYTIADAEATLAAVSGDRAFARDFFARYIQGHDVADYARLLAARRLRRAEAQPGTRLARRSAARIARRRARRRRSCAPTWPDLRCRASTRTTSCSRSTASAIDGDGDVAAVLQRHKPGDTVADRVRRSDRQRRRRDGRRWPRIRTSRSCRSNARRHADRGAEGVPRSLAGSEVMPCSLASAHRRGARRRQFRARPQDPEARQEPTDQPQQLEAGGRARSAGSKRGSPASSSPR